MRTKLTADQGGGNAALPQVGDQVDVQEQPVGKNHEALDPTVQHHFQVTLKAAALVVNVGQERQEIGLIERVFDTPQDPRAVRVGHVKNHDSDRVAPLAAERAGKQVGAVP